MQSLPESQRCGQVWQNFLLLLARVIRSDYQSKQEQRLTAMELLAPCARQIAQELQQDPSTSSAGAIRAALHSLTHHRDNAAGPVTVAAAAAATSSAAVSCALRQYDAKVRKQFRISMKFLIRTLDSESSWEQL